MGTHDRSTIGAREVGAAACFMTTVGLGAWVLPDAWLSGAVVGLGIGLLVAGFVFVLANARSGDQRPGSRPTASEGRPPREARTPRTERPAFRAPRATRAARPGSGAHRGPAHA